MIQQLREAMPLASSPHTYSVIMTQFMETRWAGSRRERASKKFELPFAVPGKIHSSKAMWEFYGESYWTMCSFSIVWAISLSPGSRARAASNNEHAESSPEMSPFSSISWTVPNPYATQLAAMSRASVPKSSHTRSIEANRVALAFNLSLSPSALR